MTFMLTFCWELFQLGDLSGLQEGQEGEVSLLLLSQEASPVDDPSLQGPGRVNVI